MCRALRQILESMHGLEFKVATCWQESDGGAVYLLIQGHRKMRPIRRF